MPSINTRNVDKFTSSVNTSTNSDILSPTALNTYRKIVNQNLPENNLLFLLDNININKHKEYIKIKLNNQETKQTVKTTDTINKLKDELIILNFFLKLKDLDLQIQNLKQQIIENRLKAENELQELLLEVTQMHIL